MKKLSRDELEDLVLRQIDRAPGLYLMYVQYIKYQSWGPNSNHDRSQKRFHGVHVATAKRCPPI